MNKVKNMITGWIVWATLALAPQVANAQNNINGMVANTINGVSQNDFNIEHQLILQHKFKQESARGWRLNQNLTYQRLLNHAVSRHQTLTWWMHSIAQSRTVRECNESSPTNSNLYSERIAALEGYIDCLYENEIAKWRTPQNILDSSYELQEINHMASENVMRDLVNKTISEIDDIYFNNTYQHNMRGKWYGDLLIRKGALLNPGSKAYRWLRGE